MLSSSSKLLSLVVATAFIFSLDVMARSPAAASALHQPLRPTAPGAPIVVNDLEDTMSTCVVTCTLRAAIAVANSTPGVDAIAFGVSGIITLTNSLPAIGDDVMIDGMDQAITISGANLYQVLAVNISRTLHLNALTIIDGKCNNCNGGGIANQGMLKVSNSRISSNNADGNGGGIYNAGTLTVTNSTFSSNFAYGTQGGGGIYNAGLAAIINSTLFGNSARFTFGGGGGIYNVGTAMVANSTLSNNSVFFDSDLASTIHNAGTMTLQNTIVSNTSDNVNCSGTIINAGHNLDNGTACGWGTSHGSLSNTDPRLSPLADNGGSTPTMALLFGSPAIDAGDDAGCPATDQRGAARPIGYHCDIGAYEAFIHYTFLPVITK